MDAVRAANVLNGTDRDCATWIKTYRDYKPGERRHGRRLPPDRARRAAAGGRRRGGREARDGPGMSARAERGDSSVAKGAVVSTPAATSVETRLRPGPRQGCDDGMPNRRLSGENPYAEHGEHPSEPDG